MFDILKMLENFKQGSPYIFLIDYNTVDDF